MYWSTVQWIPIACETADLRERFWSFKVFQSSATQVNIISSLQSYLDSSYPNFLWFWVRSTSFFQAWWLDLPTNLWSGVLIPTPPSSEIPGSQDFYISKSVGGGLCVDAHGILLYMENNYFYFSMHSSSLYSIFANWLCEHPRIHEYYTSSIWCHTTSWLEPVSLTLRTSLRLRQIKLDDSSSHEYCHVTSHMRSHGLCEDVSVYAKPVVAMRLDTVRCSRWNSQSPTREDEAEILTPCKVVFKHYALHSKWIPYIWVSEDIIRLASH